MSNYKLSVISNGGGASFEALVIASKLNLIPFEISLVTTPGSSICDRVNRLGVPVLYTKKGSSQSVEDFHHTLAVKIKEKQNPDLVLFLNNVDNPTKQFLQIFQDQTLLFEDSFPGQPKCNSLKTLDYLKYKIIDKAGLTVYLVNYDKKTDSNSLEVLETIPLKTVFPQLNTELNSKLEPTFAQQAQSQEKCLLISALFRWIYFNSNKKLFLENCFGYLEFSRYGKVRDLYNYFESPDHQDHIQSVLCIHQTSRLSSFDRYITEIKGRGHLLTIISKWWFDNTRHIIKNHLLSVHDDVMFVKPARIIPLEIVVRAYITGSTKTSLWVNYQNNRTYCGILFPEGLKKNEKLENLVITPTTKGEIDEPISENEIIDQKYLTKNEWEFISKTSINLFKFGQKIADQMGYILVDTKYEFGYDSDDNIMLIDEIHTPDSSRYWIKETYNERFSSGIEPEKIDKDGIRDYLKDILDDPYNDPIPEIPEEKKKEVLNSYFTFAKSLTSMELSLEEFQEKVQNCLERSYFNSDIERNIEYQELNTVLAPPEIQLLYDHSYHGKFENKLTPIANFIISKIKGYLYLVTDFKNSRVQKAFSKKGIPSSLISLSLVKDPNYVVMITSIINKLIKTTKILVMVLGDPNQDLSVYLHQNLKCPVLFLSQDPEESELDRNANLVDLILRLN